VNNPIYSSKFKSVAFAMMTPLLSAAVLISAQPAQAQSFTDVVRNALGANNNSSFNSNNYLAGNNNGLNSAQAASINNLNTTRAQANASISTAVANGTLSVDQASLYQNQLNANANEQNNYVNSGNFNFAQMQSVLTNLQNINTSITSSIATGATNNFNTNTNLNSAYNNNGNNYGWNNGRRNRGNGRWNNGYNQVNTSYWTGIDSQLSAALNRIQDGLNNRSLTQYEFNDLKRQYDLIVSREAQYKASGGRFSNGERTALERQIDALNSSITREVTDRERQNNRHGRWH
jgi:polyhydroxyalkanoate synthesis regulator phasin